MSTAASAGDTGRNKRDDAQAGAQQSGTQGGKEGGGRVRKAGLFDIRTFIAALLGFDGVVILLMGLFGDQSTTVDQSPPININLYAGIGLVVTAVIFETWKRLRPVKVVEPPPGSEEAPRAAH
jgi:hypothetical protein